VVFDQIAFITSRNQNTACRHELKETTINKQISVQNFFNCGNSDVLYRGSTVRDIILMGSIATVTSVAHFGRIQSIKTTGKGATLTNKFQVWTVI